MATLIKFGSEVAIKESTDKVSASGWLVQFDKVDVDKQFFTKETDFGFDGEIITKPLMYRHGKSAYAKKRRYGQLTITRKENGLWCETEIDTTRPYAKQIVKLLKENKLGWSSGSSEHCVEFVKQSNGTEAIEQWFLAEGSLTPNPAQPDNRAVVKSVKSVEEMDVNADMLEPENGDQPIKESDDDLTSEETDTVAETNATKSGAIKDYYTPYSVGSALSSLRDLLLSPKKFLNLSAIGTALRELAKLVEAGDLSAFNDDYSMNEEVEKKLKTIFKETGLTDLVESTDLSAHAIKAGRRNSNNDQSLLDSAHAAIVKAGASCTGNTPATRRKESDASNSTDSVLNTDAKDALAERSRLKERIADLETQLSSETELRQDADNQLQQLLRLK